VVSVMVAGVAAVTVRRTAGRLGAAGRLGGPQVAFGTRLALGPGRGAIVGVALSTAGLVGAFTLEHSIAHVLSTPALYGADFDVGNFLDSGADRRALAEQLRPDPDIDAVSLVWTQLPTASPVHVVGPSGEADADPNALENIKGTVSIRQTRGRAPGRVDEVAVGRAMMDQLGAKVGDLIAATGSRGTAQLMIVGDNLDPGVDVAGQGFALTLDGLAALVDATIQGTVVRFAIGTDHAALIDRYPDLDLTPVSPPSEVLHMGQLGGLPGRVGQLLTLLGIAALLNAIALTVRLGRRELAIHRALGFTSIQVAGAHLWQGVITAFTGSAVGLGVGLVVARAIHRQLVTNVGAVPEYVVPGAVWLVTLGALAACLAAAAATTAVALRRGPGAELRAE
jgi:FtsX-like permease family protein